ncbi:MAG: hypothetical protein L0Y71_05510 [Gemmataceae bacterium]|nr:hypothetical protein [Gemmataceae bacterium]
MRLRAASGVIVLVLDQFFKGAAFNEGGAIPAGAAGGLDGVPAPGPLMVRSASWALVAASVP